MYSKIKNPETNRFVSINSRIGRRVLNNYLNMSNINDVSNLEQTGGASYKENDLIIIYAGGISSVETVGEDMISGKPLRDTVYRGPFVNSDTPLPLGKTWKGPSFKSTIDVLEKQLSKNTSSIELDSSLSRKNIESTFFDIDRTFQKMWDSETSVRDLIALGGEPLFGDADQEAIDIAERNKEKASRGGTATSIILNMANGKDVKYEEHPVIIQIPKKGDTKLKEVLGPLKGGSSFDGCTVKNCVHTDAFGSDKFVLRDFEGHPANPYIMFTKTGVHGKFKNKTCPTPRSSKENIDILVNWLNSPKNKTFVEQNKKLAYQIYQLWPRCKGLKISF